MGCVFHLALQPGHGVVDQPHRILLLQHGLRSQTASPADSAHGDQTKPRAISIVRKRSERQGKGQLLRKAETD